MRRRVTHRDVGPLAAAIYAASMAAGSPVAVAQADLSVDASAAPPIASPPASVGGRVTYVRGDCGAIERRWDGTILDESIADGDEPFRRGVGHPFRGIGSPGRDFEMDTTFHATSSRGPSGRETLGYAFGLGFNGVVANLGGPLIERLCLTAGLDFVPLAGLASDDLLTGGHLGGRVGLLTRTRDDTVRLHGEAEVVLPSWDHSVEGAADRSRRIQAGVSGAFARGVIEEMLTLSPLDWGVRGIARVQYQWAVGARQADFAGWIDVRVALGYAQLTTEYGPRGGLVGGVEIGLLLGATPGRATHGGVRAGARAAIGFGSLWPTDVVLPFEIAGTVEYAVVSRGSFVTSERLRDRSAVLLEAPSAGSSVALDVGATFPRLFALDSALGSESYFRLGVRYIVSFTNN